jgi:integrase
VARPCYRAAVRIFRRGKTWWAQYRGRRVSLHVTDRDAAERAFRELQRRAADPAYRATDQTTLNEAIEAFAAYQHERRRSLATIRRTDKSRGHLVRIMGDVLLATLTAVDVDRYVSTRRTETAAPLTIARELQALSGAWRIALRAGRVSLPWEALAPAIDLEYRPLERALDYAQIGVLRSNLPAHRAAVVGFIAATAADWRSVELAQKADFDPASKSVLVRGTKNALRWRTLPVLPCFREWLEDAAAHVPFAPWGNAVRDLAAACKRAGVPRVTPRDLRRSHAKILRALGVVPSLIAPMLGHRDGRMVERVYGRLEPAELGALVLAQSGTKLVRTPRGKGRRAG